MQVQYPFAIRRDGKVATAGDDDHLRQMIAQVLFTVPGERVNRPDFGCGLNTLLFDPLNNELVAVTRALVQGSLLKWLGDLIHVEAVEVRAEQSQMTIWVKYTVLATRQRRLESFVA